MGSLLYVADVYAVREFNPTSSLVTTRAGSSTMGTSDGNGTGAQFTAASSAASDGTYVYVADGVRIRRVIPSSPWTVTTMFGAFGGGAQDGDSTTGRLGDMLTLQVVGDMLYVADLRNAALRRIDLSAQPYTITTVAGSLGTPSFVDGYGTDARFKAPLALTYDGRSVIVADDNLIRQVDPSTMRVTTLVGRPECHSSVDGDHASAAFHVPRAVTYLSATGNLYVVDIVENVLREIQ